MLIEFTVGNYRSFGAAQTLSLSAARINSRDESLDAGAVVEAGRGERLLKCAALYGANAGGKSNLVEALRFMRRMVLGSSKDTQAGEPIEAEPFRLSTSLRGQPSHFEAVFVAEGRQFRYGFDVTPERVESEWLFEARSSRETRLFVREGQDVRAGSTFREGHGLEERTRENALFLSVAAQFNGPVALQIVAWFRELAILSGLEDRESRLFTLRQMEDEAHKSEIVEFIKKLDVGIADIQVEQVVEPPPVPKSDPEYLDKELRRLEIRFQRMITEPPISKGTVITVHPRLDEAGKLDGFEIFDMARHESAGTQKLFALTGRVMEALRGGRTLIVDELDARLHPVLTRAIVRLFNGREGNPRGAQLAFATHDTNLLDRRLLRRDQVWFAEKDDAGATHLYSLVKIETPQGKVRNDASFEADYIRGRYGAIPFLGDLARAFDADKDEASATSISDGGGSDAL